MTLEVLFAQAAQGRTFLLMLLCGAGLALALKCAGLLHRRHHPLGHGADLLCVMTAAAALSEILLQSGAGLRLYALLGLLLGASAACTGIWPVLQALGGVLRRIRTKISPPRRQESSPPPQN